MNLDRNQALQLVRQVIRSKSNGTVNVIFSPSFLYLQEISNLCRDVTGFSVSAQDCHHLDSGAYTGEVSASMIKSSGAEHVILGHSERRMHNQESNLILKDKVDVALDNELSVIFCCGENLSEREDGSHFACVSNQLKQSIFHLSSANFANIIIAYEPIWAIGTGRTASPEQAQEMHAFIRSLLADNYNVELAESTSILYGGSCNPSNSFSLFSQPDIDGGLIGGASLDYSSFLSIIDSF